MDFIKNLDKKLTDSIVDAVTNAASGAIENFVHVDEIDEQDEKSDSDKKNSKTLTNNYNVKKTVESVDEITVLLDSLEKEAPVSVKAAIESQLQVIKFIQSPNLIDTTLDTMILGLKKSLKSCKNEEEIEQIRECFQLMIQNYVFFLDAKLQYEINKNKEEGRKLLCDAGGVLAQSVTKVALAATTGGNTLSVIVNNPFSDEFFNEDKGLLKRFLDWWNEDKIEKEKRKNFYESLYKCCRKLGKYQSLIGDSILISGIVERYAKEISNHYFSLTLEENRLGTFEDEKSNFITEIEEEIEENKQEQINWFNLYWIPSGIILGISLLVALFRVIIHIFSSAQTGWFISQMGITIAIIAIIFIYSIIKEVIRVRTCHKLAMNLEIEKDEKIEKFLANLKQKFDELSSESKLMYDELMKIAKSFDEDKNSGDNSKEILEHLVDVALEDDVITEAEQNFLQMKAKEYGVSEDELQMMIVSRKK